MATREVSFNINLTPGVSQLRNQLQSIVQLSQSNMLRIQHAEEQHALRINTLRKKMHDMEKQGMNEEAQQHQQVLKAIESEEERHALKMRQMRERAQLQAKQQAEKDAQGGGGGSLRRAGGAYGFEVIGRVANALLPSFIGASVQKGAEVAALGKYLGMTGAAAAGLGADFAALSLMVKPVIFGFEKLAETAQTVVASISQIGGARNLQEMLTEGAGAERLAAQISANITEKLGTNDVLEMINKLSARTEFKPDQIGAMFSAFKGKTGNISSLFNLGTFGPDLATVSGMGPEATGSLLGQLQAQFGLQGLGLRNAALMLWQQGKAGTVELKDAESISQALAFSRAAGGGNLQRGMALEMGAVQLAQKGIGGAKADEAVTSIRRLQEDLEKKPDQIRAAIRSPGAIGGRDAAGSFIFNNFTDTLARLSLASLQNRLPPKLIDERAIRAPRAIGEYVAQLPQFQAAQTDEQRVAAIKEQIMALSESKVVVDEFDGALKKVQDTVDYQFKQAFNEISVELEGVFLPVMKELIPVLHSLAGDIVAHKDQIGEAFKELVQDIILVAQALPQVAETALSFAQSLMSAAEWVLKMVPGKPGSLEDAQKTLAGTQANLATMEANPTYNEPRNKWVLDAMRKEVADAQRDVNMWQGIKNIENINLQDWARQHRFPINVPQVPDVISGADPKAASTKLDTTNNHLSDSKSIQQKTHDILMSIDKNIKEHGGRGFVPSPTRSHDGQ